MRSCVRGPRVGDGRTLPARERQETSHGNEVLDVAVVGDGFAALAACAALRDRGLKVRRFDGPEGDVDGASDRTAAPVEFFGRGAFALPGAPLVWDARQEAFGLLLHMLGLSGRARPLTGELSTLLEVRAGRLHTVERNGVARWATVAASWMGRGREAGAAAAPQHGSGNADAEASSVSPFAAGPLFALDHGIEALRAALEGAAGPERPRIVGVRRDGDRLRLEVSRAGAAARASAPGTFSARSLIVATEPGSAAVLGAALGAEHGDDARALLFAGTAVPLVVVTWEEAAGSGSGSRAESPRLPRALGWWRAPKELGLGLVTLCLSELEPDVEEHLRVAGAEAPRRFLTVVGGPHTPEHAMLDDAALTRVLEEEVRALGGRVGRVARISRCMHASRLADSVDPPALAHLARAGVIVASGWLAEGSLDDAVRSGFAAADEACAFIAAREVPAPVRPPTAVPEIPERRKAPPVFVLGVAYRDAPTDVRARLAALERGEAAPSRALVQGGYADGVVVLETCSRIEWIVSSSKPRWAMELLKSALAVRAPDARFHAKVGHAAAHYLLRVGMGLDSVAEGEPAVGRQLVLAFERAHRDGTADRTLRLCWRSLQQLLGDRRRRGVVQHGLGVQTLVLEELRARGVTASSPVLVYGQGEIGRAVLQALKDGGFGHVDGYRRADHAVFLRDVQTAHAVVVCTGGPAAFLELPAASQPPGSGQKPVVVDVGVPEQVKLAPGWARVTLEALLQQPRRMLDDESRAWLVAQVGQVAERLARELSDPPPATTLSSIDEERRVFLRETLPPLLEKLPQQAAEEVRKAVATFAHHLIERVREGGLQ